MGAELGATGERVPLRRAHGKPTCEPPVAGELVALAEEYAHLLRSDPEVEEQPDQF